ncbi:MAG: O-antigen polysaccharide polymerase Wzy [Myxococcota bacterium]
MSESGFPGAQERGEGAIPHDSLVAWGTSNRWGLLLPPVLLICLFFYGAIAGYQGSNLVVFSLGTATLTLGLVPVAINNSFEWRNGHVLISLLALVYAGYFGIPALVRYAPVSGGVVPGSMGDRLVQSEAVIDAQLVILLGFVTLLLAYMNPLLRRRSARTGSTSWDWTPRTTAFVATGMLLMGWSISIILSSSSASQIFGTGFISTLASAQIFCVIPLVLLWQRYDSKAALIALLIIIPISTVIGFLTGSKREALNTIAIVFLTLTVLRGRFGWRWIAIGVLGLALLYPLTAYYQNYLIGDARTSAIEVLKNPQRIFTALGRFVTESDLSDHLEDGLEATALRIDGLGVNAVIQSDTPSVVPYQNGRTLALFFIAPIPRALWPGKPVFTVGQWVTDNYSHGLDTNTAPTQIGEFYFNFGIPGVIGGMLLLGTVLRIVNDTFVGPNITAPALLIVVVAIYYLCTKFESAVSKQYANLLFAAVPILAVHFAARIFGGCVRVHTDAPDADSRDNQDALSSLGGLGSAE